MAFKQHSSRSKRLRVLTTGLAAFITVALLMAYQFVSDRRQLEEELRTQAMIIGASSSAALLFEDQAAAKEILTIIRLVPRILGGALYRADWALVRKRERCPWRFSGEYRPVQSEQPGRDGNRA